MPFFMSSYFIAHGIETWDNHHLGSLCDWDRVAILQRGGADDTAPRIPQEYFFFITFRLALRHTWHLAKRWNSWIDFIGQWTRWHSSGMIKNMSV